MKKVLLVGNSQSVLHDAIAWFSDKTEDYLIEDIAIDNKNHGRALYGNRLINILGYMEIKPDNYDILYLCFTNDRGTDLAKQLNLPLEKCISYVQPRVGNHIVELNCKEDINDLYNHIREIEDLNPLEKFFFQDEHLESRKWLHYFEIYHKHFNKYIGKSPIIMEVGVLNGGSLQMWKNYFGEDSTIIGIDIDPNTKQFENPDKNIFIEIGSQGDKTFWKIMKEKYPHVDILIDDGSHLMDHQTITFEEMFPHIAFGGTYLCEDLHTSYWKGYEGGYKRPGTFVEYTKNLIDTINAWNSIEPYFGVTSNSSRIDGIHFYTSVIVVDKARVGYPMELMIGNNHIISDQYGFKE